ncbi:MAG: rod shape-determining protein MreC [Agathobacter sp.]|nr:rod shape-determining protein MreC [Agathobacter sp.]
MKKIRKGKKGQLHTKHMLWILTGVCCVTIFLGLVFNIKGGPLNTIAGYIFIPMQEGINRTGAWIFNTSNDFRTLSDVLEENERLKAQVDELTIQLTDSKMDSYELENLRELLQLDEEYSSFEKIAASVVAKDSGNWFSSFTINRGSNHGIEPGMNVIASGGLVGIVTDVGPNYSKVRSIIDDISKVSAMMPTTGDNFIVNGDLKSMNTDMTISFSGLRDPDNEIKVGDPVVTSYVSDQYHQGILIGHITTIEDGANNLTKVGTITPVVDFEHLEEVLVITKLKEIGSELETEE